MASEVVSPSSPSGSSLLDMLAAEGLITLNLRGFHRSHGVETHGRAPCRSTVLWMAITGSYSHEVDPSEGEESWMETPQNLEET